MKFPYEVRFQDRPGRLMTGYMFLSMRDALEFCHIVSAESGQWAWIRDGHLPDDHPDSVLATFRGGREYVANPLFV